MEVNQVGHVTETSLEALNAPHADGQQVAEFELALSGDKGGLGMTALNELGRMKEQFGQAKKELQTQLSTPGYGPNDLMQMQWSLMRITLQEELIAKTVGRLTQNVETLMKTQ